MSRLDLHGLTALVLAAGVVAAVVILALETVLHGGPLSDLEGNVLATVIGAIIGAVATFLGVSKSGGPPPEPPTKE